MTGPRFSRRTLIQASAALFAAPLGTLADQAASSSDETRLLKGWEYYRGDLGGIWEAWRTTKQAEGDFLVWEKVAMPHCFNDRDACDPDHAYYQGPGWYRTHLAIKNPFAGGRTLLHFEGSGQKTQLYVGLERVGEEHIGGYDQWVVDITDAASRGADKQGLVPVAIFCDSSRDLEMIPSSQSDFCLYGGLYRFVNLVYVPGVSLERVHVATDVQPGGKARISIKARLYNPGAATNPVDMRVKISDPDGKMLRDAPLHGVAPWTGGRELLSLEIAAPQLWSPATPKLYHCEVTLEGQQGRMSVAEPFGLRHFEFVENGPFKLNGERLLLRGTCLHEDWAGVAGAVPDDLNRKQMLAMKKMGANMVRLGHYQQSDVALDSCDELGILVWEEIPWCRGGLGTNRYRDQARRMLRNMIDQHYNHPAVILWGLGNENDWPGDFPTFDKTAIREFMAELNGIAHDLDSSRMTVIRRCDFAKDIPDVYSPSIWAGWYRGRYTEYKKSCEDEFRKIKRFIHAEWGGDSHARRHSENPNTGLSAVKTGAGADERSGDYLLTGGSARPSRDGDWSETYICDLFDWTLKEQETMPWLTGALQWAFKDFPTPLRPENPIPRMNQKGLLERDGNPKEGYYVFQSYWAEKPMVHLYAHTWPIRWGAKGESRWVKVYSNCSEVELFHNGQSCGARRRNSQDFPAAGLRWNLPFQEGENHLKAVGRKGGNEVSDEITFQYQTQKWGPPARLELREAGRRDATVTVEARLFDAADVQCLDARNLLRFSLAGAGTLIDNLGTSITSRVVQMYNGRALVNLKSGAGDSSVSVESEGVPGAILKVGA